MLVMCIALQSTYTLHVERHYLGDSSAISNNKDKHGCAIPGPVEMPATTPASYRKKLFSSYETLSRAPSLPLSQHA
jgi:hypothetical protein